jgi:hypothetical protein
MRSIVNPNDTARDSSCRMAGQRRSAAVLMPLMAVLLIAVPIAGLAMPAHLDLGIGDFASGLASGSQFTASFLSRMWAGDWLRLSCQFAGRAWQRFHHPVPVRCIRAPQVVAPFRATDRR